MEDKNLAGIEYMLKELLSIGSQCNKILSLKDYLYKEELVLDVLHKKHRELRSVPKLVKIQQVPTPEELADQFKKDLQQYSYRTFLIFNFPIFGKIFFKKTILFWIIESVENVYKVYDDHNMYLNPLYLKNIEEGVFNLCTKMEDNSKYYFKKSADDIFMLVNNEFSFLYMELKKFNDRLAYEESYINESLDKINEIRLRETQKRKL